jgi:hypothetical protein
MIWITGSFVVDNVAVYLSTTTVYTSKSIAKIRKVLVNGKGKESYFYYFAQL